MGTRATVRRMQGTPAIIEFHYEALAYCKREKRVCHYLHAQKCGNENSLYYQKECVGYTECTEFTSEDRYCDKVGKAARKDNKKKRKGNSFSARVNVAKGKRDLPEGAIGNDPRFVSLFEQFKKR